ncbi:MAG: APC family permease [Polyangiaceae bacterium]|jgi:basic amino acid/polyamine antiporter, APA family
MSAQPARGLGVIDASLIVVGCIVGAGIFLVSPDVAREVRSPAAFLFTWLLGGFIALSGALSNGELGGLFPRSGGEYVYLREAYGPVLGFLSGWTSFWIGFPGSIATLAAGFGATLAALLGFGGQRTPLLVGVLAVAGVTLVNTLGLYPGKWTQNVLSVTKLAAFALLLALGMLVRRGDSSGLTPFFVAGDSVGGIARGLVPVLFAYTGWNAATYVAGEMREPTRGVGRALALGTFLCVVLYIAVNVVYLRALPLASLADSTDPARATAVRLGGDAVGRLLSPLVAVCVLSSLQGTVLVGPRIYQAMAIDGLFFAPLGRTHARTGTPVVALVVQGLVAMTLLVVGSLGSLGRGFDRVFDQLLTFTMSAIVAFSTLAVAAVIVLRIRRPDAPRPFRVPGYPLVPALFVVVNAWLLWSELQYADQQVAKGEGRVGLFASLAIVAAGVPAYFAFRHGQAKEGEKVS